MIRSNKLKSAMQDIDRISVSSVMKEFNVIAEQQAKRPDQPVVVHTQTTYADSKPVDIVLDSVLQVSQKTQDGKVVKAKFKVCDKWLKPNNVFTVVGMDKPKTEANARILFCQGNTWYIRRCMQAASTVHVKLISSPERKD